MAISRSVIRFTVRLLINTSIFSLLMRHCVSLCFIVLFMFLYNIVSGQLALLLLINDRYFLTIDDAFSWLCYSKTCGQVLKLLSSLSGVGAILKAAAIIEQLQICYTPVQNS